MSALVTHVSKKRRIVVEEPVALNNDCSDDEENVSLDLSNPFDLDAKVDAGGVRSVTIRGIDFLQHNRMNFQDHALTSLAVLDAGVGWVDLPNTIQKIQVHQNAIHKTCLTLKLGTTNALETLILSSHSVIQLIDSVKKPSVLRLFVLDLDEFVCSTNLFASRLMIGPNVSCVPDNISCTYMRILPHRNIIFLLSTISSETCLFLEGLMVDIGDMDKIYLTVPKKKFSAPKLKYIAFFNRSSADQSLVTSFCKKHLMFLFEGSWSFNYGLADIIYFENNALNDCKSIFPFLEFSCE